MLDRRDPADEEREDAEQERAEERHCERRRQEQAGHRRAVESPGDEPAATPDATRRPRRPRARRPRRAGPAARRGRVPASGEEGERARPRERRGGRRGKASDSAEQRLRPACAEVSDYADEKHSVARQAPRQPRHKGDATMTTEVTSRARPGVPARSSRESILSFPVLDREPGRVGRRLASAARRGPPRLDVSLWRAARLRGDRRSLDSLRVCSSRVSSCTSTASRTTTRRLIGFLARHRSGGLTDASLVGSIMAGGVVLPIVAGVALAGRRRSPGTGASRRFLLLRARGRVRVLSRDDARHPSAPPGGPPARDAARERELPVRPHRRVDRRLLRHRAARSRRASRTALRGSPSGPLRRSSPVFVAFARMYRGMHHPLDVVGRRGHRRRGAACARARQPRGAAGRGARAAG